MSYMMSLGSQPVGELYLTPIGAPKKGEPKEAFLIAHYYSGGDVKLLKFKEPLEEPEEGSPMDRIIKNEDNILEIYNLMKTHAEYIKEIHESFKNLLGLDLDPQHKKLNTEISDLTEKIIKIEEFVETRNELLKCEDAKYVACNIELCQAKRGW